MIYVDPIATYDPSMISRRAKRHGDQWCHLFCDPGEEKYLHSLAKLIGLKRDWFHQGSISHYDLTPAMRDKAILAGAKPVAHAEMREWARRTRDQRRKNFLMIQANRRVG